MALRVTADQYLAERGKNAAAPAPVIQQEDPISTFQRFTGAVLGFAKDAAIGTVQAGVKLGLSVGETPRQAIRNPLKEVEPSNFGVTVFGKEIKSIQRSTFERNVALSEGKINLKQYMGGAATDVLDIAQFMPGVGGAAKLTDIVVSSGGKQLVKNVFKGMAVGSGYGAGYAGAGAMEQNAPWQQVKESAVEGAKVGAIAGGTLAGGATALAGFVEKRRAKRAATVEEPKPDAQKPAPVKTSEQIAREGARPKGRFIDSVTGKPKETIPDRKPLADVLPPKEKPKKSNIDDLIKKSGYIDYTEVPALKTPEGKEANGRSKYDIKRGRGTIEVKKGADDSTKAHEFAHVVNNRLGEGDKASNEIAAFASGSRQVAPKAVVEYNRAKGVTKPEQVAESARTIASEMKKAARLDKNVEHRLSSPSEEFSTAFSNALINPEATRKVAPEFYAFVRRQVDDVEKKVEINISPKSESLLKDFGASIERKGGTFKVSGNRAEAHVPGKAKIVFNISEKAKGKDLNQLVGEIKAKMNPQSHKTAKVEPKKPVSSTKSEKVNQVTEKQPQKRSVPVEKKEAQVKEINGEKTVTEKTTVPESVNTKAPKKSLEDQAKEFVSKKKNKFREYNRAEHEAVRDHAHLLGNRLTAERHKSNPSKVVIKRLEKAIDVAEREMISIRTGQKYRLSDDFEEATGIKITPEQEAKIIELNQKIFGDEDVKITAQIMTPEGQSALGVYKDNMIKILDGQADPRESYYHEAVHKYLDTFLTADEHAGLLIDYAKLKGIDDILEAEEMIAESFIKYAKSREGVTGAVKVMFDKIINRVKAAFGNGDAVQALYTDILDGKKRKTSTKPIEPKTASAQPVRPKDTTKTTAKMDTFEGVKQMADELAASDKVQRDIQSRGVVSWEETEAAAKELGLSLGNVRNIAKKAQDAAAQVEAIRQIRANKMQEYYDFRTQFPHNLESIPRADKQAIAEKLQELIFIDRSLRSINTEYGRAVGINRKAVTPEEYEVAMGVAKDLDALNMPSLTAAEKAKKMTDILAPDNMFSLGIKAGIEARTAWMLYKPMTHEANLIGNIWKTVSVPFQKAIAGTGVFGKGIERGEATAHVRGAQDAMPEAWAGLKEDLVNVFGKLEYLGDDKVDGQGSRKIKEFLLRLGASEKLAERVDAVNKISFSVLQAGDKFFRTINGAGELYSQALRKAKDEGLQGKALVDRITTLIDDPGQDEKFLEAITRATDTSVYQERNRLLGQMNALREQFFIAKIFVPFLKTVANIQLEAVRLTPLGHFRPLYNKAFANTKVPIGLGREMTQAEKALAHAQASVGTAIGLYGMHLWNEGKITGSAPDYNTSSAEGRDEFYAKHPAYSIKIGDQWYSYRRIEPIATYLATVVNIAETMSRDEIEGQEKVTKMISLFGRNFLDQPFVKGITDVYDAISDPERKGQKFINSMAQSMVPFQSLFRGIKEANDPYIREVKTVGDAIRDTFPITSETLPAKIDVRGNAISRGATATERIASPFARTKDGSDAVTEALSEADYNISNFQAENIRNIRLDGKAKEDWLRIVGKKREEALRELVESADFKELGPEEKSEALKDEVTRVTAELREEAIEDIQDDLEDRKSLSKKEQQRVNESLKGKLYESIKTIGKREGIL